MDLTRREWLGAAAVLTAAPQFKLLAQGGPKVTPEKFGAVGDGVTNDTAAFVQMCEFVNRVGGGTIVLSPKTYLVGSQTQDPNSSWAFIPGKIMEFDGCTKELTILGNGARLKAADGLRFGTFDRTTGQPTNHQMPYAQGGEIASPYQALILIQNCTGNVYVEDVELDGNLAGLLIGGQFGDTGWQLPGDGLRLMNNLGNERVARVYSHHHARDGIYIDGPATRPTSSTLQDITSEYNARQGCSIVGGCNYSFVNSRFNHTGRGRIGSAPGAGVDLESEVNPVRNVSFSGCEFSNNMGVGLLADSGDTEGGTFKSCRFIGTDNWSAWPYKPRFTFADCTFVGALVHPFWDQDDPTRANQFTNCSFLDDVALSPTGKVFGPSQAIVNMAESYNVLFDGCRFDLKYDCLLPWSWHAHYNNCAMSQASTGDGHPKGTYTGVCTINSNGAVDLYGTVILGDLTVNGTLMPRTS